MVWRIKADDREFEAPDIDTLKTWIKERRIRAEHYVYHPILEKWMYVRDVEELRPLLNVPTSTPQPQPQRIIVEQKKKTSVVTWGCLFLIVIIVLVGIVSSVFKKDTTTTTQTTKTPAKTQPAKQMTPEEHLQTAKKIMETRTYKEDALSDAGLNEIESHLLAINRTSPQYDEAQQLLKEVKTKRGSAQAKALGLKWNYSESSDSMGRGQVKMAEVSSMNTVNFGFPYDGEQRATLRLRKHPKFGNDVILDFNKAHFLCDSWDGCAVSVRFGDGKPQSFTAMPPSDHSTNTLFIQNYARFVSSMKKVEKVSVEAEFYQDGNRVFEFDTSDLQW